MKPDFALKHRYVGLGEIIDDDLYYTLPEMPNSKMNSFGSALHIEYDVPDRAPDGALEEFFDTVVFDRVKQAWKECYAY
jgi:hypothetical protein